MGIISIRLARKREARVEMLQKLSDLEGMAVLAPIKNKVGTVKQAYFDDSEWAFRFFVVDTRRSHGKREVLLSPLAAKDIKPAERVLSVFLEDEQVLEGPSAEDFNFYSKNIQEQELKAYYGWPREAMDDANLKSDSEKDEKTFVLPEAIPFSKSEKDSEQFLLCQTEFLKKCKIDASNTQFGKVKDVLFEMQTWRIKFLAINTGGWLPGEAVLIPVEYAKIDYDNQLIKVPFSHDVLKGAPIFDQKNDFSSEEEENVVAYYREKATGKHLPHHNK